MSDTSKTETGGVGFVGLLTLAFIVLKLCKVIAWSWWWVLAPVWIAIGLIILGLAIFILVQYIKERRTSRRGLRR